MVSKCLCVNIKYQHFHCLTFYDINITHSMAPFRSFHQVFLLFYQQLVGICVAKIHQYGQLMKNMVVLVPHLD